MIARISACLISLIIVACASTGVEPSNITENEGTFTSENSASVAEANVQGLNTSQLTQTAAATGVSYDPGEKICRRERQTGSNFSVRICQTRVETEAHAQADQDIMNV